MKPGKNILVILFSLFIPLLLFINVMQGFRHERFIREIERKEMEQKEWFEENKKMVAALSVYSSPGRVQKIVEENSDLRTARPGQLIVVRFKPETESMDSEQ